MTTTEIQPALTPEQWTAMARGKEIRATETSYSLVSGDIAVFDDMGRVAEIDSDDRHMAAALCLHRQPFGFTPEDVEALRAADERIRAEWDHPNNPEPPTLRNLAAKIAALLPPTDHL